MDCRNQEWTQEDNEEVTGLVQMRDGDDLD